MNPIDNALAGLFGSVFSGLFHDAIIRKVALTHDGAGGGTSTYTDVPVKARPDSVTNEMRRSGYAPQDGRFIVLKAGGPAALSPDDRLVFDGARYVIADIEAFPTHWAFRGTMTRAA